MVDLSDTQRTRERGHAVAHPVVAVVLAVALALGLATARPDGRAEGIVIGKDIDLSTPGPLGPVTVFGDSVLLGAGLWGPTLPDRLQALGWGPIRFRAGVGYKAGPTTDSTSAGWWIDTWRRQGWDAPNVIVNLGANDSGICLTDVTCARRRILDVVATIGADHRIWWPMITQRSGSGASADAWNTALAQIAGERSDFFTWNWPAEMASGGYRSTDNIHLDVDGYRRRSQRMATQFTEQLARADRVGGDVGLPAPTAEPSTFVPISPVRVVDTRHDAPGRRTTDSTFAVSLGARLPAGATAVAFNLTAAGPTADGYLAVGPCGTPTNGSTVNFTSGVSRGAMTVTPVDANGSVCVSNRGETDVIVDLQGAFVGGPDGSGFVPLALNQRLVDTRATGRSADLVVSMPVGAAAVALNLTVVNATEPGWLRAAPCGATTGVSNVNYGVDEAVAGSAFVTTSDQGTVCVQTSSSADVIVDLTGTFGDGGLSFVPVVPTRLLDTRNAIGGWSPIHGSGQTLDVRAAPDGAAAVTGTLTTVGPISGGYLVAFGCGPMPPTSSVNAVAGQTLANSVTTGVSTAGRLCVHADRTTQTLFDVTGWWFG